MRTGLTRVGRPIVVVALVAAVVYQGWDQLSAIELSDLDVGLLPAILVVQLVSALLLVASQVPLLGLHRWFPRPGGADGLPFPVLMRTTLVGTALSYVVPGGPAVSSVYQARRYRKEGVPSSVALQSQLAVTSATGVGLGGIALVGALVPGASARAHLDAVELVLVVTIAGGMVLVSGGLGLLLRGERTSAWLSRSRWVTWITGVVPSAEVAPVLSLTRLVVSTGLTVLYLLADLACLALALVAAGEQVPWVVLLLAYGAAQIIGLFPLTPGGLGLLEGGLAALIVVPAAQGGAVALAVLVYRGFSWGAWVVAGGVAWVDIRRSGGTLQTA